VYLRHAAWRFVGGDNCVLSAQLLAFVSNELSCLLTKFNR